MSEYLVNSGDLVSVADAIRAKGETTETLVFPGGFVAAIETMETGKTGATLTVTTPAEGVTVTVAKGELSYTKTTGADGTAVFSGLESGTWTITISDGAQTATGTVDIDADYASNMTFFAATINVTYPSGSICTATDGVTTLTAPDTSGTWACVVRNAGTWTVSLGNGFSESVEIEQNGETYTVDKWYLYNSGDQRTYITGGWNSDGITSGQSGVSVTAGNLASDRINIYGAGKTETVLCTNNMISFLGFTKLVANCNVLSTSGSYSAMDFAIRSTKGSVRGWKSVVFTDGTGNKTLNLPINSMDSGYVQVHCGGDSNYKTDVFSIWLEV